MDVESSDTPEAFLFLFVLRGSASLTSVSSPGGWKFAKYWLRAVQSSHTSECPFSEEFSVRVVMSDNMHCRRYHNYRQTQQLWNAPGLCFLIHKRMT